MANTDDSIKKELRKAIEQGGGIANTNQQKLKNTSPIDTSEISDHGSSQLSLIFENGMVPPASPGTNIYSENIGDYVDLSEEDADLKYAMALSMGLIAEIPKSESEPKATVPSNTLTSPIPTSSNNNVPLVEASFVKPEILPEVDPKIENKNKQEAIDLDIINSLPGNLITYWFTQKGMSELKAIIEYCSIKAQDPDVQKRSSFLKNVQNDHAFFEQMAKTIESAKIQGLKACDFHTRSITDKVNNSQEITKKVNWWFKDYTNYIRQKTAEVGATLLDKKSNSNTNAFIPIKEDSDADLIKAIEASKQDTVFSGTSEEEALKMALKASLQETTRSGHSKPHSGTLTFRPERKTIAEERQKEEDASKSNDKPNADTSSSTTATSNSSLVNPNVSPSLTNDIPVVSSVVAPSALNAASTLATTNAETTVIHPPLSPRPPLREQIARQKAELEQLKRAIQEDQAKFEQDYQKYLGRKINKEENWEKRILSLLQEKNEKAQTLETLQKTESNFFRNNDRKLEEARQSLETATQNYINAVQEQEIDLKKFEREAAEFTKRQAYINENKSKLNQTLQRFSLIEAEILAGEMQQDVKLQSDVPIAPSADLKTALDQAPPSTETQRANPTLPTNSQIESSQALSFYQPYVPSFRGGAHDNFTDLSIYQYSNSSNTAEKTPPANAESGGPIDYLRQLHQALEQTRHLLTRNDASTFKPTDNSGIK